MCSSKTTQAIKYLIAELDSALKITQVDQVSLIYDNSTENYEHFSRKIGGKVSHIFGVFSYIQVYTFLTALKNS